MSRKRKGLPLLQSIEIEAIAAEGKSLAHVEGKVVFVPFVIPGDIVDIQVTKKRKSYMEGNVVKIHQYSSERTQPFCSHFGVCGGCKWQILPYEKQIAYKQQQVVDAITRIGHLSCNQILPILGSKKTQEYRNKLEFGFSNKKWLTTEQIESGEKFDCMSGVGFHIPGAFDKILDIQECRLMSDINNKLRNGIRSYALEHNLSFYDIRNHEGVLRNMMIRISDTGEVMLLIQFRFHQSSDEKDALGLLQWIKENFPEVTSLLYVDNQKYNDTLADLDIKTYHGTDFIYETMENLKFKVGPKSFYQTNTDQAYELYKVTREFAELTGDELVYDLYTGTGTIANFVAKQAKKVIGIEYVPDAIEDAKNNSKINQIDNTLFYAGDMKDILTKDFIAEHGRPDVIITDPPRAGMHSDVVDTILLAEPRKIVYVSCNPATQARDLQALSTKYDLIKVQPVDMFPQTHHVENVVQLYLRETY